LDKRALVRWDFSFSRNWGSEIQMARVTRVLRTTNFEQDGDGIGHEGISQYESFCDKLGG
jgi:hypothetical protein